MTDIFPILFSAHGLPDILRVIRQHGSEAVCIQVPRAMMEAHEDQPSKTIARASAFWRSAEALAVVRDEPYKNDMEYGSANALLLLEVQRWHEMLRSPLSAPRKRS